MNITQKHLGIGLVLACAFGLLAGCVASQVPVSRKPSYADFDIKFLPEGSASPTDMVITPDGGNAFLESVSVPGPKDNKIIWKSKKEFQIRFAQVEDPTKPLESDKKLGDPDNGKWNGATAVGNVWEYKLTLKASSGREPKETVTAKYFVKLVNPEVIFDPVLIISH